jgi:hypothetical protein
MNLKSVKGRFVGRYGSREQALAALHSNEMSYYDAGIAVKNPNLTKEDLHGIATAPFAPLAYYRQHAHNEYFHRYGEMVK